MKNIQTYDYYVTVTVEEKVKNTVMPIIVERLRTLSKNLQGIKTEMEQCKKVKKEH